jgi:hypothetical protein
VLGVEAGPCGGCRVGAGSPFTVPHLIKQEIAGWWSVVGVAGWNTYRCWFGRLRGSCLGGLGTLLGPEETPASAGFSWWTISGLCGLTRTVVFVVAVVVGRGVVVC